MTDKQASMFDIRPEIIDETSTERDGQRFASPMSQMKTKKTVTMSVGSSQFQISAGTANKLHDWLVRQFNMGKTFGDSIEKLVEKL
jgi:hypothetical protein